MIELRGVRKYYQMGDSTVRALDGIDLDIQSGEFISITGASGSGKSSLIQAGLFHQLLQGKQIPESDRWMIKCFRPGNNPFKSLAQCLVEEGTKKAKAQQQLQIEGLNYNSFPAQAIQFLEIFCALGSE